jgi:hypothetical protein
MPDFYAAAKHLCYTHNVTHYSSGLPVNATYETYIAGLLTTSDDSGAIQDALLAQVHATQALRTATLLFSRPPCGTTDSPTSL